MVVVSHVSEEIITKCIKWHSCIYVWYLSTPQLGYGNIRSSGDDIYIDNLLSSFLRVSLALVYKEPLNYEAHSVP